MKAKVIAEVRARSGDACEWCYRKIGLALHHIEPRGPGGRHGPAKEESDSARNLVHLCRVCHGAAHGERVIESDGYSCDFCPVSWACEYARLERTCS